MTSANLTREETAHRSAHHTLHTIDVDLDLTGAPDRNQPGFPTTTTLTFDSTESSTWLDFIGLDVKSVTVNGTDIPVSWDGARIALTGLTDTNTVVVTAVGAYSRSGEGLHRFHDPADNQTYLYTQYEPADSRRVMACFEQPDMKGEVAFTVSAPEEWLVLANGAQTNTSIADGIQTSSFARTKPLSSYITAVAAGPYYRVTDSWKRGDLEIPLSVACRASLADHFDAAELIAITKQGLDFYADAFDFPYPWGKYDQIFVPEYNLGAMENPGLVTFNEKFVFRGAATDAQYEGRANTMLHEMAHMWFGDLVTMKWWDDLWLKESFADYMGSHALAVATRFSQAWVTFANSRKAWAYTQDQLPTTHPIVADIPDLEAAKLNFDGITYAKGAAVLKQLAAFVGEEQFFEGARRYFKAHAFGNTTLNDFLVELEAASGRDMRAWAAAWLQTSGMSTISFDSETRQIVQTDPRPHTLNVGLYSYTDGNLEKAENRRIDLVHERTPIDLPDADLILINDDDLTFAKVRLDERSLETAQRSLSALPTDMSRGLVWSALWNATRDGLLPAETYLSIVADHAAVESNVGILSVVLAHASYAVEHYTPSADVPAARRSWLDTTWDGLSTTSGDCQLAWARAFASAATTDDHRADYIAALLAGDAELPGTLALDDSLRWLFVEALAATGHMSVEAIHAEALSDNTASGKTNELLALSSLPERAVREAAWERAWNDESLSNEHLSAVIEGVKAGGRRDLIASLDNSYFERITEVWSSKSIEMARRLVRDAFPASETTDLVDTWLENHPKAPGALRRLVIEQRDNLARDIRVRASMK
ncbi:aminopeptidase N [Arcanobacterium haemolyticum]|nr:aminopeptidase N [Arcanobacterium haemolyticum]